MNDIEILEEFIKYYETEYFKGKKLNSSIKIIVDEDDIEAIKNLIQRNKDLEQIEQEHKEENGRLREEITELEMDKQQQKFEINCLNSDIKNMYCEEAILSILEDEFDLSKNEAMNILENY